MVCLSAAAVAPPRRIAWSSHRDVAGLVKVITRPITTSGFARQTGNDLGAVLALVLDLRRSIAQLWEVLSAVAVELTFCDCCAALTPQQGIDESTLRIYGAASFTRHQHVCNAGRQVLLNQAANRTAGLLIEVLILGDIRMGGGGRSAYSADLPSSAVILPDAE